jgi:hypothetical protein
VQNARSRWCCAPIKLLGNSGFDGVLTSVAQLAEFMEPLAGYTNFSQIDNVRSSDISPPRNVTSGLAVVYCICKPYFGPHDDAQAIGVRLAGRLGNPGVVQRGLRYLARLEQLTRCSRLNKPRRCTVNERWKIL